MNSGTIVGGEGGWGLNKDHTFNIFHFSPSLREPLKKCNLLSLGIVLKGVMGFRPILIAFQKL
jgi:hypothetical protein